MKHTVRTEIARPRFRQYRRGLRDGLPLAVGAVTAWFWLGLFRVSVACFLTVPVSEPILLPLGSPRFCRLPEKYLPVPSGTIEKEQTIHRLSFF